MNISKDRFDLQKVSSSILSANDIKSTDIERKSFKLHNT